MPKRTASNDEIEIWLADGPEIDEIVDYITLLQTESDMLRRYVPKSDLYRINYELDRSTKGSGELDIRRKWSRDVSALNLKWAKRLAKYKQERSNE